MDDDNKRYYKILGLKTGASEEDVKNAYRDLVQVWHPDRFTHNPSLQKKAEEQLKEINIAYEAIRTHIASTHKSTVQSGADKTIHKNHHEKARKQASAYYARPQKSGPVSTKSSGRKYIILILLFFILSAAGYGVFLYMQPDSKADSEVFKGLIYPEGLRIASVSKSVDENHDFLIGGVIENTTNKEWPDWYVVVDIYGPQGKVLDSARMWNGKQLYTTRDYEILAKRGVDVKQLRANNLYEPGVVIPPKGTVHFEMRFMEVSNAISGFNATLQPFDPVRLYKEIYLSHILPENDESPTR
jgi:hypothetical protein